MELYQNDIKLFTRYYFAGGKYEVTDYSDNYAYLPDGAVIPDGDDNNGSGGGISEGPIPRDSITIEITPNIKFPGDKTADITIDFPRPPTTEQVYYTDRILYVDDSPYNATIAYTPDRENKHFYIHRDRQGSVRHISNANGYMLATYYYDPWGRQTDSLGNAYAPYKEPLLLLGRGYTGHEHLPWFNLINMNARLYDPFVGRFLSPDPYVQAPGLLQNFNRYTYCMNNPLIYTDPSGEAWWHWLLGIASFGMISFEPLSFLNTISVTLGTAATTAGVTAAMVPVTAGMFAGTANSIDLAIIPGIFVTNPQRGAKRLKNSLKLLGGLFVVDENRGFWENAGMLLSRWTWENIQTWSGYGYSSSQNIFDNIDRVDYFGGATFATNENAGCNDGISLGNYININIRDEITGSFDERVLSDPLFMHEYGHTIDSRLFGFSYLFAIGIPSIFSANKAKNDPSYHHYEYWTETRANRRAEKYFKKHFNINWNYPRYPLK
jgi:RHS repeat-associated protein